MKSEKQDCGLLLFQKVTDRITRLRRDLKEKIEQKIRAAKAKLSRDETVEDQAQTFRIWMWASSAGLALIVIASVVSMASGAKDPASAPTEKSMFDQLPDGFMVVPIEPANIDSLDSIFEEHGYADLYRSNEDGAKGKRLARGLAIIRAPRNPRRFAVLVREEQSEILSELGQPVFVALRKGPPKTRERTEDPEPKKKTRKSSSPLYREPRVAIDIIEERLPTVVENEGV